MVKTPTCELINMPDGNQSLVDILCDRAIASLGAELS